MARRKETSRVTESGGAPTRQGYDPAPSLPSIRQRRPVLYWTTVVAVAAMVLSTLASFVTAFA